MSIISTLCRVCDHVSLEGEPPTIKCIECDFRFHEYCSCAKDVSKFEDLDKYWVEDDEDCNGNEVDSKICPICQGELVLAEDANRIWGYLSGLELSGVTHLSTELVEPLITIPNFRLELNFINSMEEDAAKILASKRGSLTTGVKDGRILEILKERLEQSEEDDPKISDISCGVVDHVFEVAGSNPSFYN